MHTMHNKWETHFSNFHLLCDIFMLPQNVIPKSEGLLVLTFFSLHLLHFI